MQLNVTDGRYYTQIKIFTCVTLGMLEDEINQFAKNNTVVDVKILPTDLPVYNGMVIYREFE